jgi:hypothetical protein
MTAKHDSHSNVLLPSSTNNVLDGNSNITIPLYNRSIPAPICSRNSMHTFLLMNPDIKSIVNYKCFKKEVYKSHYATHFNDAIEYMVYHMATRKQLETLLIQLKRPKKKQKFDKREHCCKRLKEGNIEHSKKLLFPLLQSLLFEAYVKRIDYAAFFDAFKNAIQRAKNAHMNQDPFASCLKSWKKRILKNKYKMNRINKMCDLVMLFQ